MNRLRFLLEIVAVMRAEVGPKRLLSIRLNGDDLLDGGLGIDEYGKIARILADNGVDLIHVSAGTYRVMDRRIPPMYLQGETFAHYAFPIKKASGLPVIASGTIHDMAEANRLVDSGEADFIGLARPLFADPDLPNKVFSRRYKEVIPCIRCNTCVGREQDGKRAYCSINPRTGHETNQGEPPRSQRSISVVGAGPAGIQIALVAAGRGHRVRLWEKKREIGGLVRVAAQLPFKHTLPRLLRYYETALIRAKVAVHVGEEPNLQTLNDDLIVLATGLPWQTPVNIKRDASIPVIGVEEAIAKSGELEGRILVVGAGLIGLEIAWALASKCKVVVAERDAGLDEDVNLHARLVLLPALAKCRVEFRFNSTADSIVGTAVQFTESGQAAIDDFDAVIWTPRIRGPATIPVDSAALPKIIAVGECDGARGLLESNWSAYRKGIAL